MRKINLLCAVFAACGMALSLGAAPRNDSDPEVLSSKGGRRNYTGVYPVKTIAIITPGSYPNPKTANPAIKMLRKAGYKVKVYPNVFLRPKGVEKNRYLSSPVEVRVKDFEAAWCDMENDMILCARGGWGTVDLVEKVNWAKLPRRPELFVMGYSDVTMLLCALYAKGYGRPIAGANLTSHGGLSPALIPEMKKMFHGEALKPIKLKTMVPGDCSGKPVAGLLARLALTVRKNYGVDTKGRILIIECVRSTPEKIRKDLDELFAAKFFEGASGLVFGHFLQSGKDEVIDKILEDFSKKLNIPVYRGMPFGHHSKHLSIDFSRDIVIKDGILTFPAVKK